MPSIFPNEYDTDLEIPRVDQNITEINGDVINSLRDAIFAMQKAIGLDGPGNKPSLVDRIGVSIDADGNINKDALSAVGLVTLPIINKHIGDTAGIVESKLKLNYSTQSLKNSIESLKTDVSSSQTGLATTISAINTHVLGTGNFHDGYHIKINSTGSPQIGISGLEALTIGDALNELAQILISGSDTLIPHIDGGLAVGLKHAAAGIGIDASGFSTIDRNSTTVQEALDSIDEESGALGLSHLDEFHANGILKTISSGSAYNSNQLLHTLSSGAYYDEGTSVVTIPGVSSFSSLGIKTGDIIKISGTNIADSGTYQIRTIGPLSGGDTLGWLPTLNSDQLAVFHTFVESRATNDSVEINIYRPASVSSEYAPLSSSVRHNATVADSIMVLSPNAARVVSVGFNNSIINCDGYEIGLKIGVGAGIYRHVIVPNLNRFRLGSGQAQPVSASSVAERINAYVADPDLNIHAPISAYRIGNEIAIAHNWVGPNYTLEIVDGYSGNFAMGFDAYGANITGSTIIGNDNNAYVVNGVSRSDVRTVFDGYAEITADTSTLLLWDNNGNLINPLRFGIRSGSVMHVYDHPLPDVNGSYTLFYANSVSVFTFSNEPIVADDTNASTRFNVLFTDSAVALNELYSPETDRGIVQIYIDASGKTMLHDRLAYGSNLGSSIEIIDVSQNFPIGNIILSVTTNGNNDHFFSLVDDSLSGELVRVHDEFDGKFKLYHPNNVDYVIINLIPGTLSSGVQSIIVKQIPVLDEAMEICNAHYDGSLSITNIIDTRLFGNMGANEIRDDFIELFSQRQVDDLRSDGVVRGFDLLDIPFIDDLSLMQALPIRGGTAYISGVRVTTETQKVIIPSFDENGTMLNSVRRIVGINEFGTIQSYSDELGEILSDGYASSVKFGKILPLYRLDLVNGGISNIVDLRLFINNLDDKIDLIVDETNNVVGNFRTLDGALLYAENYPGAEKLTVRIMNTVNPTRPIVVPRGVSILGGAQFGGDSKHQIIASGFFNDKFITLNGDNRIENIEISAHTSFNNSLLFINGSNVSVTKCLLQYDDVIDTNSGNVAVEISINSLTDIHITSNKIRNVFSGIIGLHGVSKLVITDNEVNNLSGTGGTSLGISLGTASNVAESILIHNNTIKVPDLANDSDVRGIQIDVGLAIKLLRITNNFIIHSDATEMTNGIRIENSAVTGYKVKQLFITDNYISGIKLDDNEVYGIYVSDVDDLIIDRNKLENIGTNGDGNNDVVVINALNNIYNATISNNIIVDCDCGAGIQLQYGDGYYNTGRTIISNNILRNMGTASWYIATNVSHSNISGNTLVGPGDQGIRVTGTRSIISNNHLSKPNDGGLTDYAFSDKAIHVQTSDIDISNNSITGMEYDQLSVGISNVNSSRERIKIVGNTISGTKMAQLIQLYGAGHTVCDNRLYNNEKANATDSFFIELNTVSTSLISGNSFQGAGTRCITNRVRGTSTDTILSNVTIVNNDVNVSFSGTSPFGPIMLQDSSSTGSTVTHCLISNNRAPTDSVSGSVNHVGIAATTTTAINTNLIGINSGVTDTISIPFSMAFSPGTYGSAWAVSGTWWYVAGWASGSRVLYIPIIGPPNGSKLVSVRITGVYDSAGVIDDPPNTSALTAEVIRKSLNDSGFPTYSLSAQTDIRNVVIGIRNGIGDFDLTSEHTVNYDESEYFIKITSSGTISSFNGLTTQIHGAVVTFRG